MFFSFLRPSLFAIAIWAATANAANFVDCTSDEQNVLSAAASAGHKLVADGYHYVSGLSGNDSTRVTTWFGSDLSAEGLVNIVGRLKILNDADISNFTYNCSGSANIPIWSLSRDFGVYNVLPRVTTLPSTGDGSATQMWLYGFLTFSIGDTQTYPVLVEGSGGATDTMELAEYGSIVTLKNAYTYVYFLENDPPLP